MKKAAIVGCGAISKVHSEVIKNLENVKLVACADTIKERAQSLAKEHNAAVYTDFDEMICKEKIDVIHICTPHYLHTEMAEKAQEKGIAVFTEKPPVISYEQWEKFKKLSKTPLGICFQNRYNKSVQYVKELLNSGKVGKILGARAFVTWSRGESYYTESSWRGSLETEGGGVLINQSIHTLDLLIYLLGKPSVTEGSYVNHSLKNIIEVEDTVEAFIKFENGARAIFYASNAYTTDSPVLIEIHCENMTINMQEERIIITEKTGARHETLFKKAQLMGKDYWGESHLFCIADFYKSIEENKRPTIGIREVEDTVISMLEIYK